MVWLGNYYMFVVKHNEDVLHLKRAPTWRSVLLFAVFWAITHFVSMQAKFHLEYLCYVLGLWFAYLATEKYEECIFDKKKGTVTMMNCRFLQNYTIGYNKKIVSELKEVIAVTVESSSRMMFVGSAHQVVLLYYTGLTLSITAAATYGDKKHHEEIGHVIKRFLGIPTAGENGDLSRSAEEVDRDKKTK